MWGKKKPTKWCKIFAKKLKGSWVIAVFLNPDGLTPGSPTYGTKITDFHPFINLDCGICYNVTSFGGTIQSPDFPNKYSNSMDCAYRIGVTPGKTINMTFGEFLVESDFDYVIVSFNLRKRKLFLWQMQFQVHTLLTTSIINFNSFV